MARYTIANHEPVLEAIKEGMKVTPSLPYNNGGGCAIDVWCGEARGTVKVLVFAEFKKIVGIHTTPKVDWEKGYITINKK